MGSNCSGDTRHDSRLGQMLGLGTACGANSREDSYGCFVCALPQAPPPGIAIGSTEERVLTQRAMRFARIVAFHSFKLCFFSWKGFFFEKMYRALQETEDVAAKYRPGFFVSSSRQMLRMLECASQLAEMCFQEWSLHAKATTLRRQGYAGYRRPFRFKKYDEVVVDLDGDKVKRLCVGDARGQASAAKFGGSWTPKKGKYVGQCGVVVGMDRIGVGIRVKFSDGHWWSFAPEALHVRVAGLLEQRRAHLREADDDFSFRLPRWEEVAPSKEAAKSSHCAKRRKGPYGRLMAAARPLLARQTSLQSPTTESLPEMQVELHRAVRIRVRAPFEKETLAEYRVELHSRVCAGLEQGAVGLEICKWYVDEVMVDGEQVSEDCMARVSEQVYDEMLPAVFEYSLRRCIPEALRLASPNGARECEGTYTLVLGHMPNGYPLWCQARGGRWLFAGTDGMLLVGHEEQRRCNFFCNEGVIASIHAHAGLLPHEVLSGWQRDDGRAWQRDAGIVVVASA